MNCPDLICQYRKSMVLRQNDALFLTKTVYPLTAKILLSVRSETKSRPFLRDVLKPRTMDHQICKNVRTPPFQRNEKKKLQIRIDQDQRKPEDQIRAAQKAKEKHRESIDEQINEAQLYRNETIDLISDAQYS